MWREEQHLFSNAPRCSLFLPSWPFSFQREFETMGTSAAQIIESKATKREKCRSLMLRVVDKEKSVLLAKAHEKFREWMTGYAFPFPLFDGCYPATSRIKGFKNHNSIVPFDERRCLMQKTNTWLHIWQKIDFLVCQIQSLIQWWL
ncbi:hypothetical protein H3V17_11005 [Bartonella sp. M0283]|uniref:hypothetical protein n=1 Tax=Bartonella sp. M0283 TaxID=2751016 RepID=UPI0018DC0BEA|nr:hypothetical protein [Bartonella sp. M0283]MBI0164165.1 hypothetical protein [Bartonella sp. M0283]